MQRRSLSSREDAFTLVEMLVVMAVIAVLIALVAPVTNGLLRGNLLTQSGETVADQIIAARQAALTNSRTVQVRFYKLPQNGAGAATNYTGVETVLLEENGQTRQVSKIEQLRNGIMFAADGTHSTLLVPPGGALTTVSGTETLAGFGKQQCAYVGFQILPNGSTDLDPTAAADYGGWFVTLIDANKPVPASGTPNDYYTLRVEALDGHVQTFRP